MPRRTPLLFIVPSALGALAANSAAAATDLVAFHYDAHVTTIEDPAGDLTGALAPGDALSLSALFDPSASDDNPDPVWGAFASTGDFHSPRLTLTAGALALTAPTASAVVANDLPGAGAGGAPMDLFRIEAAFDTLALGRHMAFFVQLLLIDDLGHAFASDALPLLTPPLHSFPAARQLLITGAIIGEPESFTIRATLDAPAPGAAAVLLAAPFLPSLRRARRKT